ncbi:hypothetical protein [Paenibacillus aestuarii]|uniref:Uncharacterized protein n=1 Tax=Paenibacillus aestuarii TaxID=516965 RepID=A0ABW0K3A2_9BACL|nr:hypothetical protein [Paenibacillus aestuarii]
MWRRREMVRRGVASQRGETSVRRGRLYSVARKRWRDTQWRRGSVELGKVRPLRSALRGHLWGACPWGSAQCAGVDSK